MTENERLTRLKDILLDERVVLEDHTPATLKAEKKVALVMSKSQFDELINLIYWNKVQ